MTRRSLTAFATLVTTAALVAGCSASPPEPAVGDPTGGEEAAQAAAYITTPEVSADIDPLHAAIMSWLGRNWGHGDLAGWGERAASGARDTLAGEGGMETEVAALARLALPEERRPLVNAHDLGIAPTSVALHAALYCDVRELTEADVELMRSLATTGGYEAPHVLLAVALAEDLGCSGDFWDEMRSTAVETTRVELEARVAGAAGNLVGAVDDLSLEQTAFLLQVGVTDVATPEWLEAIRAAQLPDGGWALEAGLDPAEATSNWHATGLGLWVLAAAEGPGAGAPIVLS